jgi:hypothetical protein
MPRLPITQHVGPFLLLKEISGWRTWEPARNTIHHKGMMFVAICRSSSRKMFGYHGDEMSDRIIHSLEVPSKRSRRCSRGVFNTGIYTQFETETWSTSCQYFNNDTTPAEGAAYSMQLSTKNDAPHLIEMMWEGCVPCGLAALWPGQWIMSATSSASGLNTSRRHSQSGRNFFDRQKKRSSKLHDQTPLRATRFCLGLFCSFH